MRQDGMDGMGSHFTEEEREECWGGERLCEWASREGGNRPIQNTVYEECRTCWLREARLNWGDVRAGVRRLLQGRGSIASRGKADGFTEEKR